jgi:hypothetical protein
MSTLALGLTRAPRGGGAILPRAHNQTRVPHGETWLLGCLVCAPAAGPNGNESLSRPYSLGSYAKTQRQWVLRKTKSNGPTQNPSLMVLSHNSIRLGSRQDPNSLCYKYSSVLLI